MDAFLVDVATLQKYTTKHELHVNDDDGHPVVAIAYIINPPMVLDQFRTKWRVALYDLQSIFQQAGDVMIAQYPQPKFQERWLLDLPTELLHYIMEFARIEDARRLGSVCRTLRAISFSHIYQRRNLALWIEPTYVDESGMRITGDRRDGYIKEYLHKVRKRFLAEVAFLLEHREILGRIRRLELSPATSNPNANYYFDRAGLYHHLIDHKEYFAPILRGVDDILAGAPQVKSLRLSDMEITPSMVASMAAMSSLHTLELISCEYIHPASEDEDGGTSAHLVLSSVHNASFFVGERINATLHALALLPNVRMLALVGDAEEFHVGLPNAAFRTAHNPFRTAERVVLQFPAYGDFPKLRKWLLAAAEEPGGLRLTHLKLQMYDSLEIEEALLLIGALRGAPLSTLVLDGMEDVSEELFDAIADSFPRLEALTLTYMHNRQRRACTPSVWPEPTWAYARRLARFPALRHFAWNFCITPLAVRAPWDLLRAEAGYPDPDSNSDADPNTADAPDEDYVFTDWRCLARLFMAHCPTLRSLEFLSHREAKLAFTIGPQRDADGRIVVEAHEPFCHISTRQDEINPELDVDLGTNAWAVGPAA
ncbi:hypothetical protein SCP_1301060 [Sparassis crispa]|uniref:F-box domain-containing protein n=1 Tax=Sparassis crispa TaxID=139825 RepID=A0A401H1I4_9APHY|nr:hypothetical protein SCP_1301060 [Sparassis crispa]GBE88291.1 hypothetical protein SCP_1301060 [Sparassis crispa]